jgi:hypothetical protein
MAERRDTNSVFSKALRILRHAKFFEPVRNLRGAPPRVRQVPGLGFGNVVQPISNAGDKSART